MDTDIRHYYERELTFIREMGSEFARKYPKIAGRLLLEPDKCEDPHVERLIEAFALLCGRIHKKIDDDFPDITEALLQILYPHYINPIPSMSVVTLDPIMPSVPPTGYQVAANTPLFSKPVNGHPCQFVTRFPVTLLPLEVVSANLREPRKARKNAQQALVIQVKCCNNLKFSQLDLQRIRFFLNGPGQHVFHIQELLYNNVCHLECVAQNREGRTIEVPLDPGAVRPVGFEPEESLIPVTTRSFPGYVLLYEFFCFPEKFLFFDLDGLGKLTGSAAQDTLDIWFYLDRPARANLLVSKETFCLHATPVVNLFSRVAEPIRIDQERTEYRVIPDIRRSMATEVFTVDRVVASGTASGTGREYRPLYSVRHHLHDAAEHGTGAFWQMTRRPSGRHGDDGTDVFLSFVDLNFKPTDPGVDTVSVNITCTNRDLPGKLPFGDKSGDFETETAAPLSAIRCLLKPTPTRRPTLGGALQWRLISHLSLNYLSLVSGGEDALKEILRLYDFDDSPATRQQISGIVSLHTEYVTKRIRSSFCRGVQVTITLDEEKFVGTGLYLFAAILERFLGQYVSVNSFTQLVVKTVQRKEALRVWPPRCGNRILL